MSEPFLPLIDLQAQYRSLEATLQEVVLQTLRDGRFVGGEVVRDFESAFAQFCGTRHAVGCANGTDAIELVLDAWGIGPGDEVLVPAMSWISTSEAVATRGAVPVFVDIDARTHCIDPKRVAAHLTPRTKAIIAVHLYGHPADLGALRHIAETHALYLLEDSAQAHGARWNNQTVGSVGHAATFSFFPSKSLGAYGDAGAVVTDDAALADTVRAIANHGMSGVRHVHTLHGRNSRLDTLQAAILTVKLPHLAEWVARKNALAARYHAQLHALAPHHLQLPYTAPGAYHGYHLFVIQTDRRDALSAYLSAQGIGNTVHYPTALPLHACYADRALRADDYPNAVELSQRALSIPLYAELSHAQQDRVCAAIQRFFTA